MSQAAENFDINSPKTTFALVWGVTVGYAFLLIMPVLVGGFVDSLGFSESEAGLIASAQMFGMMLGALTATPLVSRINLRTGIFIGIVVLLLFDVLSVYLKEPTFLSIVRFVNGVGGGFAVGMMASSIAATRNPDRVFALLLVCQYTFAAIGFFILPQLLGHYGMRGAFVFLAILALSVIAILNWFPARTRKTTHESADTGSLLNPTVIFTLLSLLLFYVANNAIWAYLDRIGVSAGIPIEQIGLGLGLSMLLAITAGLLAFFLGLKLGRIIPLAFGILAMIIGTVLLLGEVSSLVYFLSAAIFNFSLIFAVTYYLGFCAELDAAGRVVVLANFTIAAGLALGPAIAALLLDNENYQPVLTTSIGGFIVSLAIILLVLVFRKKRKSAT